MVIETRWLLFWAGRDMSRLEEAGFFFALFPDWEKAEHRHTIPVAFSVQASWEWLPKFIRINRAAFYGYRSVGYDAIAWTGRYWRIVGWRWDFFGSISLGRKSFYVRGPAFGQGRH